jgi:hypothetical protein
MGGWTANVVLYLVTVVAYYKPISLGKTFIAVVEILAGVWFLVLAFSIIGYREILKSKST